MPQGIVGLSYKVNMNNGFMLDIDFYEISIGAHYNYGEYNRRINLKTGEEITINDIINEENKPEIIKACNEQMQKKANDYIIEMKAEEGEDLTEYYGNIDFGDYNLTTFTLTPEAIIFEYSGAVPDYMRAYDLGLTCSFNYKDYGYMAKEGSILADYIQSNQELIANIDSDNASDDGSKYKIVSSLREFNDAVKNVAVNTQIVIENDINSSEPIKINRSNITISGDMSKEPLIFTPNPDSTVMVLENCEDVTIKNLRMRHITGDIGCGSGVLLLDNCKNVTIENCDISGCGAYGIFVHDNCDNIKIINNKIYDCSYYGIELHSTNSEISNNTFYRNGNEGISDYYVDADAEETLKMQNNKSLKWDKDLLIRDVDDYKQTTEADIWNYSNSWGNGLVTSYKRYDEFAYMSVEWFEIDEFRMSVYFARRMPQYVKWSIEYGETDAPDGDYEYEHDIYNYEATFEGWELTRFIEANAHDGEINITDQLELDSIRGKIIDYIENWEEIIKNNRKVEDVFEDMPVIY